LLSWFKRHENSPKEEGKKGGPEDPDHLYQLMT